MRGVPEVSERRGSYMYSIIYVQDLRGAARAGESKGESLACRFRLNEWEDCGAWGES